MLRLKTTVAACLALAAIGGIIAFSSQPAKLGSGDAKTSSTRTQSIKVRCRDDSRGGRIASIRQGDCPGP